VLFLKQDGGIVQTYIERNERFDGTGFLYQTMKPLAAADDTSITKAGYAWEDLGKGLSADKKRPVANAVETSLRTLESSALLENFQWRPNDRPLIP